MKNAPTPEQLSKLLPPLYATEEIDLEDKLVFIHFQILNSHFWGIEFDREDTFFGYVLLNGWLQDAELGYFTLSELMETKVGGWLEVENDQWWVVRPLKDIGLVQEILSFKNNIESRMAAQS